MGGFVSGVRSIDFTKPADESWKTELREHKVVMGAKGYSELKNVPEETAGAFAEKEKPKYYYIDGVRKEIGES